MKKTHWLQNFKQKNKLSGNFHNFILLQETHLDKNQDGLTRIVITIRGTE